MYKNSLSIIVIVLFSFINISNANIFNKEKSQNKHYKERNYQSVWCKNHNGVEEFQNSDKTRVDCLTKTHAIEFDFAYKWKESIGQALYYSYMTGRKAKVILILEKPEKEIVYFERVKALSKIYNFDAEYITPDIFKNNNFR